VPKEEYNEEDWSDPQSPAMMPYYLSKYKAEKAAWDYIDNLPED